jgi:hypothetical protein
MGESTRERLDSPPSAVEPEPRVHGYVDMLRPNRVAGWVVDRTDPVATVTVEIMREGALLGETLADRLRPDLASAGVGTGRYGFSHDIHPPVEPGFEFTVSVVARLPDGTKTPLARAQATGDSTSVERRLLERIYEQVMSRTLPTGGDGELIARLAAAIDRIEVAQLRIEASLEAIDQPQTRERSLSSRVIVAGAVGIAVIALIAGVWSLLIEPAATAAR